MNGRLVLVRHSESTDNQKGVWSGIRNVSLTAKGRADAYKIGGLLKDIAFDIIYISQLKRTRQTLNEILKSYGKTKAKIKKTGAIDERDYGDLAGRDKWKVRATIGLRAFNDIRRGWDVPVPNGETLKDVYERVVPWYREIVLPQLLNGKNILIVAHGNSNRALRKFLENISHEAIKYTEMDFDKVRVYEVKSNGRAKRVAIRRIKTDKTHRY
ncbi:MAG: 2,3-bisphosphoglycerate-dependent phosphoglycerate mutase [Candidatus Nomurabacteria bacterium]|jgi:2,3-bisphosphoglycerate-dependent phosphoglycerate mutase|nr:2,3-bisphosphoglycerate-dependent phosphoglycerate mutase [Candidatus Nomurabacteria bacterium]